MPRHTRSPEMRYILIFVMVVGVAGCTTGPMTKQDALLTAAALMIYKVHREDSIKDNFQLTANDSML